MVRMIKPNSSMKGRCFVSKGSGVGSVLLGTDTGVGGTYTADSPSPMGRMAGGSLGSALSAKLEKLNFQSRKKPENIRFSI